MNEDGSINSANNPAPPGSIVSVFATGCGVYQSQVADGSPGPMEPPFPVPALSVGMLVVSPSSPYPGACAEVLFAGQAPGLIAGVIQINFRLPQGTPTGKTLIAATCGNYISPYPLIYTSTR